MYCQKCGAEVKGNFCPNCGTKQGQSEVTPTATKCPVCGTEYVGTFCPKGCNSSQYQKSRKKSKKGKIALIIVACFFGFCALMGILFGEETPESTENGSATSTVSEEQIDYIKVTANELWNAFYDNEISAEQTYKGKNVEITGKVSSINSAGTLSSANITLTVDDALFGCVQCCFNDEDNAAKLAELSKGQSVTLYGRCGEVEVSNVMVYDCKIK